MRVQETPLIKICSLDPTGKHTNKHRLPKLLPILSDSPKSGKNQQTILTFLK